MAIIIKTIKIEKTPVLQVAGRLVNVDSEKFQKKLSSYIKKQSNPAIIDISDVNFIDSFGLGTLVQVHSDTTKGGGQLLIINTNSDPDTYVQRLFTMTQLNKVFTIIDNVDDLKKILAS